MKLKSFGCSFTFGTDLSDVTADGSKLTWPALIAQQYQLEYRCYAQGGCGNLSILDRLLANLSADQVDFYIVNWTWIDRFDYVDVSGVNNNDWLALRPNSNSDVAKNYYKYLHSELRDKLTTLSYIQLAIDTLKKKNCPFIMTAMDDLILDTAWNTSIAISALQSSVAPYISNFEGKNFLKWAHENQYPVSATLHPLESAHSAAAELILANAGQYIKSFGTQNTVDRWRLS